MEIIKTLDEIKPVIIKAAIKQRKSWYSNLYRDLLPSLRFVDQEIQNLLDNIIQDKTPREIESSIQLILSGLHTKLSSWKYEAEEDHQDIFINLLLEKIKSLDTEKVLDISEEDWVYDKGDNLDVTVWKIWHLLSYNTRSKYVKIKNKSRVKKQQTEEEISYRTRQFNHKDFIKYFILLPLLKMMSQEWRKFLRDSVNQILAFQQQLYKVSQASIELLQTDSEMDVQKFKSIVDEIITQLAVLHNPENGLELFSKTIESAIEDLKPVISGKWNYAGTSIIPDTRFNEERFNEKLAKIEADEDEDLDIWNNHLASMLAEWQKNIELGLYQLGILEILNKTNETLDNKLKNEIVPVFEKGGEIIEKSLAMISEEEAKESPELLELVTAESEKILGSLRREALPAMLEIILNANLEDILDTYMVSIENAHSLLSDSHTIFKKRDDTGLVPKSRVEKIFIKELAEIELLNDLREDFESHHKQVEARLNKIIRNISEIDQIVEFNLEAALSLLNAQASRKNLNESQKTILEGLDRTFHQIKELINELFVLGEVINRDLSEISINLIKQLEELSSSDKVFEYKFRLTKARAKEEFESKQKALWQKIKDAAPSLYRGIKSALTLLQTYRKRFSKLTGLSTETQRLEEDLRDYLIDAEKRVQQLPYVYQRLFRSEPWVDERFFEGRKAEMNALLDDLVKWEKGYYTNTILVGEKGSGKTTFIEYAKLKHFNGKRVYHYANLSNIPTEEILLEKLKQTFEIDNVDSFSELEKRIQRRKASICIFENINNLYLRKIGGFAVLEKFFQFITNTGNKVFWIQSCSLYGWTYLNYAKKISRYYSRIITLDSLNPDDIESILLKRHRVSGYSLNFVIPEKDDKSKQLKRINDPEKLQAILHKAYFEKLKTIASGNILVAMMYWLKSFVKEKDGTVYISSVNEFDFLSVLQLPVEDLFVLGLLIQQGEIDAENLSVCFNKSDTESRHQLVNLKNLGILIENGNSFIVNPLLYRPIVRALKTRNILH